MIMMMMRLERSQRVRDKRLLKSRLLYFQFNGSINKQFEEAKLKLIDKMSQSQKSILNSNKKK